MIAKYLFLIPIAIFLAGCGSGSSVFLSFENGEYQIKKVEDCPSSEPAVVEGIEQVIQADWRVDHVLVADADNDGIDEIIVTLWKQGSYGEELPLWVEENDENIEHHLFLYEYKDGEIVADWHSSSLSRPIQEIQVFDINNDGKNELIEIEGDYYNNQTLVGIWVWNEWWFENLWQSETGNYDNLCMK